MIEATIGHPGVIGVAQEIINPISSEHVANDDFGKNRLPVGKLEFAFFRAKRELNDVLRLDLKLFPQPLEILAHDDFLAESLGVPAFMKKLFLGGV